MKNKIICVCPECSNPLISTMLFRGAEWFCLNCKWTGGIFYEKRIDSTPELQAKQKADEKLFRQHSPDIFMGGGYLSTCDKCIDRREPHEYHLTDSEKEKMEVAMIALGLEKQNSSS